MRSGPDMDSHYQATCRVSIVGTESLPVFRRLRPLALRGDDAGQGRLACLAAKCPERNAPSARGGRDARPTFGALSFSPGWSLILLAAARTGAAAPSRAAPFQDQSAEMDHVNSG